MPLGWVGFSDYWTLGELVGRGHYKLRENTPVQRRAGPEKLELGVAGSWSTLLYLLVPTVCHWLKWLIRSMAARAQEYLRPCSLINSGTDTLRIRVDIDMSSVFISSTSHLPIFIDWSCKCNNDCCNRSHRLLTLTLNPSTNFTFATQMF